MPERRAEQGEQRERAEVDLARLDAVGRLQHLHLRREDAVRVDDPLRDAGAAAGEEDRGRFVARRRREWCTARVARPASRSRASEVSQQNRQRPAFTVVRIVFLPQPSTRRAAWAFGMPMNASGSASARHLPRFRTPMPGSISTGTAPTLNRANVSAKKSGDGGTMSTVRVPRPMPDRGEAVRDGVGVGVQFGERDRAVFGLAFGLHAAAREVDRGPAGELGRHAHEVRRDVDRGIGHVSWTGFSRHCSAGWKPVLRSVIGCFARNSRTRMITSSAASSRR